MAVATFSCAQDNVDDRMDEQLLATRYFFSQFWCEFTQEVLVEFYQEDLIYREQERNASPHKMFGGKKLNT